MRCEQLNNPVGIATQRRALAGRFNQIKGQYYKQRIVLSSSQKRMLMKTPEMYGIRAQLQAYLLIHSLQWTPLQSIILLLESTIDY